VRRPCPLIPQQLLVLRRRRRGRRPLVVMPARLRVKGCLDSQKERCDEAFQPRRLERRREANQNTRPRSRHLTSGAARQRPPDADQPIRGAGRVADARPPTSTARRRGGSPAHRNLVRTLSLPRSDIGKVAEIPTPRERRERRREAVHLHRGGCRPSRPRTWCTRAASRRSSGRSSTRRPSAASRSRRATFSEPRWADPDMSRAANRSDAGRGAGRAAWPLATRSRTATSRERVRRVQDSHGRAASPPGWGVDAAPTFHVTVANQGENPERTSACQNRHTPPGV